MTTSDRLKEILGRADKMPAVVFVISHDALAQCRDPLISRSNHLIKILKTNHWPMIELIAKGSKTDSSSILLKAINNNHLVYNYLVELRAILIRLNWLETHADNSIEWCEHEWM